MRGPEEISSARTSQLNARPAYNHHLSFTAALIESKMNTRSYSATRRGAVTMVSLHAIPEAQARTATKGQPRQPTWASAPDLDVTAARMLAWSVKGENNPTRE